MLENLEKIDQQLFLFGNSLYNTFFDMLVPHLTSFWVWIPLFIWWFIEVFKIYKRRIGIVILFLVALLFAADRSSVLIKDSVKRYRPTHNTELKDKVHIVDNYYGGQYGYVSSHASNSFAVAFFILFLLKTSSKRWIKISLFLWAIINCYTRIYLGVHYPFDLFSGALLGGILAFVFYKIFTRFNQSNIHI